MWDEANECLSAQAVKSINVGRRSGRITCHAWHVELLLRAVSERLDAIQ